MINYCIQNDKVQWEYVKAFTNAPYIVKEGFGFKDGLFTGYDEAQARLRPLHLELRDGSTTVTPRPTITLQHPRCVWNLLKEHVADLHAGDSSNAICGTPKDKFLKVAR